MCSDRAGKVFLTNTQDNEIIEYAHGGTQPVQTFFYTSRDFNPYDCSVDPTTNNLAVTAEDAPYVIIFPNEKMNRELTMIREHPYRESRSFRSGSH
jgi:hypothetical protein